MKEVKLGTFMNELITSNCPKCGTSLKISLTIGMKKMNATEAIFR